MNLSGVKLRNVQVCPAEVPTLIICEKSAETQINGNRGNNPIYQGGGANIEFGGANQNQTIEFVRSYDPRYVTAGALSGRK